jgi:hypothetical protein
VDYQLLVLIAMIVAVAIAATRHNRQAWPGRPGWQYQRVISFVFAGMLFLIPGLIGLDLRRSHGWFQGVQWVDGPVWPQVALGSGLLLLGVYWARRVPPRPTTR